jgi:hypothetical protein
MAHEAKIFLLTEEEEEAAACLEMPGTIVLRDMIVKVFSSQPHTHSAATLKHSFPSSSSSSCFPHKNLINRLQYYGGEETEK